MLLLLGTQGDFLRGSAGRRSFAVSFFRSADPSIRQSADPMIRRFAVPKQRKADEAGRFPEAPERGPGDFAPEAQGSAGPVISL